MSRFYASIEGNGGPVTRQGTPNSGISGHIRGWDIGIRVEGYDKDGKDCFTVYLTGGSNGHRSDKVVGEFVGDGGCS